jgi:imidazolonepropionase
LVNAMVRHGTTTLEAKSGYGLDARGELKILRVQAKLNRAPLDIASTFLTRGAFPPEHAGDPAGYLSWMCAELLPAIRRRAFARFAGLRCGEGGLQYGAEPPLPGDGARPRISTQDPRRPMTRRTTPCAWRWKWERPAWITCTMPDRRTWTCWRARTPWPSYCPADAFQHGFERINGRCRIRAATHRRRRGGGAGHELQSRRQLDLQHAGHRRAGVRAPGHESRGSDLRGDLQCGLRIGSGAVAGSLEVGKPADLIVLNASDYREIPYHFGVNLVNRTVKRGVTIYQEGKVAGR